MRVLFASNQAASVMRGGVLTQALQTKNALENLGVDVVFFDAWREFQPNDFDLVHIFTANMATYHLARAFRAHNLPIVVSPVFFTRRSARITRSVITTDKFISRFFRGFWTDYGLIAEMCQWAEALLPNLAAHKPLAGCRRPEDLESRAPDGIEARIAKPGPHDRVGRGDTLLWPTAIAAWNSRMNS